MGRELKEVGARELRELQKQNNDNADGVFLVLPAQKAKTVASITSTSITQTR